MWSPKHHSAELRGTPRKATPERRFRDSSNLFTYVPHDHVHAKVSFKPTGKQRLVACVYSTESHCSSSSDSRPVPKISEMHSMAFFYCLRRGHRAPMYTEDTSMCASLTLLFMSNGDLVFIDAGERLGEVSALHLRNPTSDQSSQEYSRNLPLIVSFPIKPPLRAPSLRPRY